MRTVYAKSNTLLRTFSHCSTDVKVTLFQSYCTALYCPFLWSDYKKSTFRKIRVAFNNAYRKIFGLPKRSSASAMYAQHIICNFETMTRKSWSQTATDGAWSSTTVLLSGRDRPRCLCVLRLSGSEPETRRTGSVATSLPSNSLLVARAGNVELDRYPQLMLLGQKSANMPDLD